MFLLLLLVLGHTFTLQILASSVATNFISPGQELVYGDNLFSLDGKFALGFFQTGSKSHNTLNWYFGIWFSKVPTITPVWVANCDDPIKEPALVRFTISRDGNLVVLDKPNNSMIWSSQVSIRTNTTIAVLTNNGNLVLQNTLSSSDILWQSFDHPTDTFLPGAKIGWDKDTGLTRRLVSRKNLIDPARGRYCYELGPKGLILTPLNSSIVYWSSGEWNGQYFSLIPEMVSHNLIDFKFVNNKHEEYFTFTLLNDTMIMHHRLDVSGQMKTLIWDEVSQAWLGSYSNPKAQCDVYALCGPFTVCSDNPAQYCSCMKGFSIRSQEDWELSDRSGGCVRNTPLNCKSNRSTTGMTDEFYSMSNVELPQNAYKIGAATSARECENVCLRYCSCTAYSFIDSICTIWHEELINVKQQHIDTMDTNGAVLYLRLAAKEMQTRKSGKRVTIRVTTIIIVTALSLLALILLVFLLTILRNNRGRSGGTLKNLQDGGGIIAFRYTDLQRATKNFLEKLGAGGFGSVFKGYLTESATIAVKRLDGACQGEKQFRAEVASIGVIQHINLVRLIGFCCEGERRLLAYEHMPNRSLDMHLFQNNSTVLGWSTRYKIALGVARGLAYLHERCQDLIIHCDIKPQNILLDASFVAKIADFGMAKLMGRDFSRVLTTARGTAGYLAPEWISGVAITAKVDVYSYGMVLMEIISGRQNSIEQYNAGGDCAVFFPVHAAQMLLEGDVASLVDEKLSGDVNLEEAERLCKVACWCIQDDESDRPTMGEVVRILEGLLDLEVPPMPRLLEAITRSSLPTSSYFCNPSE
ncbi:G-type lectin S-receptor-like serine/threonine-protein kinase At2g19130 [Lolium perenne]|uniref:G-type lectin S-receptor-like serine/threonine-protein kinase At2g19130 n=1 Tax=Lolium perenne TaxID=4522 RepID=UPI0021F69BEA|nr:G-type lectin S-receptor-like serine/threonine-protein kinase At2g19130 [Lolium perenne]